METILLAVVIGILCIVCFFVGAKIGQKVVRQETIELPKLNPVEKVHEILEKKEKDKEEERYKVIAENIDNYNGTSIGQKKLPS